MGAPVIMSALFHGVAIALLYIGLPHLKDDELIGERVVLIEVVTVDEVRNLPETGSEVETEKVAREENKVAEMAPPPPPPVPRSNPIVSTSPPPKPNTVAAVPPPPKPNMLPLEKEPPKQFESVRLPIHVEVPMRKPNPPSKSDPFASVLKSVEDLEVSRIERAEIEDSDSAPPTKDLFEQVLARADSEFRPDVPLSMTELDNIRYQIQKNWHLPAGGRNVQNMQVTLRIQLGPDGGVLDVSVVDQAQMTIDPFYRAMAESTVRAVLKTGRIKNLSPDKYHLWRDMKINFDPREMFG